MNRFDTNIVGASESFQRVDSVGVSKFIAQVYNWMFIGLLTTGFTSMMAVNSRSFMELILTNRAVLMFLMIAELGMVFGLVGAINKMSAKTASTLFMLYSILNGLTLSTIFLVYTSESIAGTFFVTAATFGAVSLYGHKTKKDLTSVGNLAFMGLIGVIIASVVNMFLASSALHWLLTYLGVAVFVGLTAYDTQKLKTLYAGIAVDAEGQAKVAILGALTLYLDFINLFLLLLQLFGGRRD